MSLNMCKRKISFYKCLLAVTVFFLKETLSRCASVGESGCKCVADIYEERE